MGETRGAATIVDRVEGWGHASASDSNREDNGTWGDPSGNSITATDSSKESTATRVARARRLRKSFSEAIDPAIVDRTRGYASTWEGSDETLADPADYANGVFYDETGSAETGTGSNTAHSTSDSEALASGRTADSRNTVQLNDASAAKRGEARRTSILDRTHGWGHTAGTLTFRSDDTGDENVDTVWDDDADRTEWDETVSPDA